MLQIKNVTKNYKKFVVFRDISLDFHNNSFNVLTGPSGSGKSTLLNILGALDYDNTGELYYNNELVDKNNREKYRNSIVGFVFQQLNMIENLTIRENFMLAYDLAKLDYNSKALYDILNQVNLINHIDDLEWFLDKKTNQLSVGQLQRCAIARALIKNPKILILDEPTSALDDENSIMLLDLLKELSKDRIVIMSSHNKYLVDQYADKIVVVNDKTTKIVKDYDALPKSDNCVNDWHKGDFSFFTTLKFALKNLLNNKVKLITSILLTLISMISFSITFLFQTYEKLPVLLNTQIDNKNYNGFVFNFRKFKLPGEFTETKDMTFFRDEQIKIIDQYTDGVYSPFIQVKDLYYLDNVDFSYFNSFINQKHAIEIDSNDDVTKFGLGKSRLLSDNVDSRLPSDYTEVAITDLQAMGLLMYGLTIYEDDVVTNIKPSCYDDIIGMKIGENLTVTGVYSCDDGVFDIWTEYLKKDHKNMTEKEDEYYNNCRNCFALSNTHIVKKGYTKYQDKNDRGFVYTYYVRLKGNYREDKKFIESLNMDDFVVTYNNSYSGFITIVNAFHGEIGNKLWIVITLFILISTLVAINLFHTNVKSMEKDLGILKSIGSSNKSIMNIILSQTLLICLFEYLLSILIIGIILKLINNSLTISFFTITFMCALIMLLLIFISGVIVSIISSFNIYKNKPINIVENK